MANQKIKTQFCGMSERLEKICDLIEIFSKRYAKNIES